MDHEQSDKPIPYESTVSQHQHANRAAVDRKLRAANRAINNRRSVAMQRAERRRKG